MSDLAIRVTPSELFETMWTSPSDFERAFERLSRQFFEAAPKSSLAFWGERLPALADVVDKGTSFVLRVDLPGVPKEKIDVRVNGSTVSIRAENVETTADEGYLCRERAYRQLERTLELPEPVVAEQVKAEYKDGVLSIEVPKAHPATEQKISVA